MMKQPAARLPQWLESVAPGREDGELARIADAADFAADAHQGQRRASGEPYVNHTLAVAGLAHELALDSDAVIAALLHDTVEDTEVTLEQIEKRYGVAVRRLVDGVTKMEVIQGYVGQDDHVARQAAKAESLRKMMLAMVEDVRVVLIKLCDRLHNMRTLDALPEHKQQAIARETLDIFAPLANRLGVWQIKWELEDLAFRFLEPGIYRDIARKLAERRVDRHQYIADFVTSLSGVLEANGIHATVRGRPKHIYSIWNKMQRKNIDFDHIFDVRAVRILVDDVQACYAALGVVHTNWNYIAGEFDDYIATPKENNYQSIHTAVIGPEGKVVEIQIRSHAMHEANELGIAAHWQYKEGREGDDNINRKVVWLRQLLEWTDEVADANEFVDRVKDEVFEDRVYVFSPKGRVIDLPRGATPLDFAYAIHTEVGHRCRGARVNGRMVPLTYNLRTGERVDIITSKNGTPSLDWISPHLGYTKTRRARTKIQHWFRHKNREQTIAGGRAMLEKELHRMSLADVNLDKLAQEMGFERTEDLFFKLVDGSVKPGRAASIAQRMLNPQAPTDLPLKSVASPPRDRARRRDGDKFRISGVGNLLTHLAGCCRPVPGDNIAGFITQGRGVTIHRADCANLLHNQANSPERVIDVSWGDDEGRTYPMQIAITAFDRKGLLRDIVEVFANEDINVTATDTRTDPADFMVRMLITVEVPGIEVMSRLLSKIGNLQNVQEVRRQI